MAPRAAARTATAAAASPTGSGRSVPNTASPTSAGAGFVIPDDEIEDATSGDTSTFGEMGDEPGTTDAQAVGNSQLLGASVMGQPIRPLGMPKTVRIILEESASDEIPPTGLPVSLNGRAYLIRPGEEVDVPIGVKEILDNAVMSVPVKDPQTMKVIGHRNRLRFPYRTISRS